MINNSLTKVELKKWISTYLPSKLQTEYRVSDSVEITQAQNEERSISHLRIGLFFGGASSEREISLESGRHVYNNLDRERYEIVPIFVDSMFRFWIIDEGLLWKNTTADIADSLPASGKRLFFEDLHDTIDFAFLALHGKYSEDAFPGLLEILGMPNNGASVLGGSLSMDKYRQRKILKIEGVDVPKHLGIENNDWNSDRSGVLNKIENYFSYPLIVKPSREGSSTALSKVNNADELGKAFEEAFAFDNLILVEEFIEGVELTTLVYGLENDLKAFPPSELLKKGDFLTAEEKFLPGGARMITPARLSDLELKSVQDTSIRAFKSLGLKIYSRIDSFFVKDRGVVILEPNNPPAMTPSTALWLEAAEAGFNATDFLNEIIRISLISHLNKTGPL